MKNRLIEEEEKETGQTYLSEYLDHHEGSIGTDSSWTEIERSRTPRSSESESTYSPEEAVISRLVETNHYLSVKLADLSKKYYDLVKQYSQTVQDLQNDITELRIALERIEMERTLRAEIPESWLTDQGE